ncbi:MAG: SAVED domain-containing protein [bacterium]
MFFWYEAAGLLIADLKTRLVVLEHEEASGVDDVAVFYDPPGVADAGKACMADFFQVKYHVDQREEYCSEGLIDPDFINAKTSLLKRFHDAYWRLRGKYEWFRLHLASNWRWKTGDVLAKSINERDGSLPEGFISGNSGRSFSKIRDAWMTHLSIDAMEFDDFASRLRFDLNHFGRHGFLQRLNDRLRLVGLKPVPVNCSANPYDSLAQQFVMSGMNKFDKQKLLDCCGREGLLEEPGTPTTSDLVIGIRSFMRFAERIESETRRFVCVAENFEGRNIKNPKLWKDKIIPAIRGFLDDPTLRQGQCHLVLECHMSIAFTAGYFLDRKSGVEAYPIQKGNRREVWMPSGIPSAADWGWQIEQMELNPSATDFLVAISVTHDAFKDAERYAIANSLPVRTILHAKISGGTGSSVIEGANHAAFLADRLVQEVRKVRRHNPSGISHIFAAAPNGFMFFLGRHRGGLGPVQLYEFDFEYEYERGGSYSPSISLP